MTSEHDFARVQYHMLHFTGSGYALSDNHSYLRIRGIARSYVFQNWFSFTLSVCVPDCTPAHDEAFILLVGDFFSAISAIPFFTHLGGSTVVPVLCVQVLVIGMIILVRILSEQSFFACSIS